MSNIEFATSVRPFASILLNWKSFDREAPGTFAQILDRDQGHSYRDVGYFIPIKGDSKPLKLATWLDCDTAG